MFSNIFGVANLFNGKFERTFILIKPDAVQRGLIGKIIERFEAKGFKLIGMKFVWVIYFFSLKKFENLFEKILTISN